MPWRWPSVSKVVLGVVVALGIAFLAAMIVTRIVFSFRHVTPIRPASRDVSNLTISLDRYYMDFGAYPPDDMKSVGGSAENASSEALVHYLGDELPRENRTIGPYMRFREDRLTDSDADGFKEYRDPWGGLWLYARRPPLPDAVKGDRPLRRYDLASPGPDGKLGGRMVPGKGYVPATTPEGKAAEADNVTSWR